jgi:uncharacterized protein GlcG (DUF336 family)
MLTLETARELIRAARKEADRIGKPMSVCLVDAAGYIISIDRMKGARPLTPPIALSKAYSAAIMQRPTVKLKGMAESEPSLFSQISRMGHQPVVAAYGGIPVKKNGEIIGGIGTSGGSGPEDEEVASSALRALGFETDL